MAKDKYSALWVSHTSISDFLACPRAYFIKHIYRNPSTGRKVKMVAPSLALGQAVHEVFESISKLGRDKRFSEPLPVLYDRAWQKVHGKWGGFRDESVEYKYKQRGAEMIARVVRHPGPLGTLAVKIKQDLPFMWISEEENIILCGRVDWLEYLPETNTIHVIDFKTGKNREDDQSLQLPIYRLLVEGSQERAVSKVSYWYLEESDELTPKPLPDTEEAHRRVLEIARRMYVARQAKRLDCREGAAGCRYCQTLETIVQGVAEPVGVDEFNYDMFMAPLVEDEEEAQSVIL